MVMKISMDCVVYSHLDNRPILLDEGDKCEIIEFLDWKAKIRLLEGEGKGKVFTIDRLFITN